VDRLGETRSRCLVGQLSGAVGTSATFGASGAEVLRLVMLRLGLGVPTAPWHCARDTMAEAAALFALIGGTLGRIAGEVAALQASEVGELEEPFAPGQIGSSAMPHKRNPEICETVVVAARLLRDSLPTVLEGMVQLHERDGVAWIGERVRLPEMACVVCAALHWTLYVTRGLVARPERMRKNLDSLVCSEALMARLGVAVGRQTAHGMVYRLAVEAHGQGGSFAARVLADEKVARLVPRAELERVLDPTAQVGEAAVVVDAVLTRARRARPRPAT
jgi:3-carboxy-cis,cis-muconate cycloisomerase